MFHKSMISKKKKKKKKTIKSTLKMLIYNIPNYLTPLKKSLNNLSNNHAVELSFCGIYYSTQESSCNIKGMSWSFTVIYFPTVKIWESTNFTFKLKLLDWTMMYKIQELIEFLIMPWMMKSNKNFIWRIF